MFITALAFGNLKKATGLPFRGSNKGYIKAALAISSARKPLHSYTHVLILLSLK